MSTVTRGGFFAATPSPDGGDNASHGTICDPLRVIPFERLCRDHAAARCSAHPRPQALAPAQPDAGPDYDLIIENGQVVDGTGSAWFYGDVAVKDGRIARIMPGGLLRAATAAERVDAFGHVVSPGFIDIHSLSRYALLSGDSRVISKVTQGITTEIMGEGVTTAPVNPAYLGSPGTTTRRRTSKPDSFPESEGSTSGSGPWRPGHLRKSGIFPWGRHTPRVCRRTADG